MNTFTLSLSGRGLPEVSGRKHTKMPHVNASPPNIENGKDC
jgi:hypothetical protein